MENQETHSHLLSKKVARRQIKQNINIELSPDSAQTSMACLKTNNKGCLEIFKRHLNVRSSTQFVTFACLWIKLFLVQSQVSFPSQISQTTVLSLLLISDKCLQFFWYFSKCTIVVYALMLVYYFCWCWCWCWCSICGVDVWRLFLCIGRWGPASSSGEWSDWWCGVTELRRNYPGHHWNSGMEEPAVQRTGGGQYTLTSTRLNNFTERVSAVIWELNEREQAGGKVASNTVCCVGVV